MKEVSIGRNVTCLLPYDTGGFIKKNYSIGPDFKDGSSKKHCLSCSFLPIFIYLFIYLFIYFLIYLFIYLFIKVLKSICTNKIPRLK